MLAPNEVFGPYTVLGTLGRGAMGTVYRARDARGREIAIKVMAAALAEDPDLAERFRREARAASSVKHPNITEVFDFGTQDAQLYMAMELLEGSDLGAIFASGRLPPLDDSLSVMEQVSGAMGFVHAAGLVHRDLKPGNIQLLSSGVAKIMDFGLVRYGDSNMTATGTVMGSPAYMCPELMRGQKADASADVFSLGAVFYELLCGRRAFPGKGIAQIMMAVLGNEPAPLSDVAPRVPPPVGRIVERCLSKDPASRYRNAGELHAAVELACFVYR